MRGLFAKVKRQTNSTIKTHRSLKDYRNNKKHTK